MFELDIVQQTEIHQLWPLMILILAMAMVLFSWFTLDRKTARLLIGTIIGFCLPAAALTAFNLYTDPEILFLPTSVLYGTVAFDSVYLFIIMLFSLFLLAVLTLSLDFFKKDEKWNWPVYLCAFLGSLIGVILLASTRHLILFAIAVELSFLSNCILSVFGRPQGSTNEGIRRYALTGLVSSAVMIYGLSLLYGQTGCLEVPKIALRLSMGGITPAEAMGLGCFAVGLLFQIGLVPFQGACASVFRSIGADLATWLSVVPMAAGLIAFARFFQMFAWFNSDQFNHAVVWVLGTLAVLTMSWGNIAAFRQTGLKKMLGWSTVAQAGYLMLGVLIWRDNSGLAAVMAYLIVLVLMNFGVFAVAGVMERESGSDDLLVLAGLWGRNRFLALVMTLSLLSLIGLPPFAGFTVKWNLLFVLWHKGLAVPAGIMAVNILISLFYYLRIVRTMAIPATNREKIFTPPLPAVFMGIAVTGLVLLFFIRGPFFRFVNEMLFGFFG